MVASEEDRRAEGPDLPLAVGALACLGSVVTIALMILNGESRSPDDAAVVAPALWVLGALVLAPLGHPTRGPVSLLATACYAIAFLFPAAVSPSAGIPGYKAFFVGWAVVPLAWLANPAFVIGLVLRRRGRSRRAALVAVTGLLLALTALGMAWADWSPGGGFWLWALAPGLLALGCALEPAVARPTG